jgi:hypothetical protein
MTVEQTQEQIAKLLRTYDDWESLLEESMNPSVHVQECSVYVEPEDIFVNVELKEFRFENAQLDARIIIGGIVDGEDGSFSRDAISGRGEYDCPDDDEVTSISVESIEGNFDITDDEA